MGARIVGDTVEIVSTGPTFDHVGAAIQRCVEEQPEYLMRLSILHDGARGQMVDEFVGKPLTEELKARMTQRRKEIGDRIHASGLL